MNQVNLNEVNQFGIDQSLKAADIAGAMITSIATIDRNGDGKVQAMEGILAAQNVAFKVVNNRPDIKQLKLEAGDYSEAEKAELSLTLSQTTQLPSAKTDRLVDLAFKILLDVIDFVAELSAPEEEFEV